MPLPLAPIAGIVLRYGLVAAAGYAASRKIGKGFHDQRAEEALDDLDEGLSVHRRPGELKGTGRLRRVIVPGGDGRRRYEIDISGIARIRVRCV